MELFCNFYFGCIIWKLFRENFLRFVNRLRYLSVPEIHLSHSQLVKKVWIDLGLFLIYFLCFSHY